MRRCTDTAYFAAPGCIKLPLGTTATVLASLDRFGVFA